MSATLTPDDDVTSPRPSIWRRLYHGDTDFQFVAHARRGFVLSGVVILIGVVGLLARGGLNLGIDFTGGSQWEVPAQGVSVTDAEDAIEGLGFTEVSVQEVGDDLRVQTPPLEGTDAERQDASNEVITALTDLTGAAPEEVVVNDVGPSWGDEISEKALRALVFFMLAILIYITVRFELRMAVATIAALFHDILVVVGIYALFQLPVTPATVVAFLTILGFSIYDSIVIFDRVDENTRLLTSGTKMTYSEMVDLSLNQVLMRSINTQITALLPILSVLLVGSLVLGQASLQEFGMALFLGQLTGAYSSIFIAAPILAKLKEREPRYKAMHQRISERREAGRSPIEGDDAALPDADATAPAGATTGSSSSPKAARKVPKGAVPPRPSGARTHPPRPRKKGKKR
ncbi:protein translocase subunit SecF [Iamia majanohamensis]|uniref:Protein-export membrane protein SecF n=1 Tax=Iamia majanohamensis TaxID=467976 RepID=A0AAE9Y8R3_9ACTN|nr:protein translocase subunit SecF [Iamia majanohamensis]WCO68989.1 protein translocase subunit SecF [Iamia majanohamensis]